MLRSILSVGRQTIARCWHQQAAALSSGAVAEASKVDAAPKEAAEDVPEPVVPDELEVKAELTHKKKYSTDAIARLKLDQYPFYVEREWWKKGKRMTFWATWRQLRDVNRREVIQETGAERMRLKALKWNTVLPQAIRDGAAEDLHNMPKYSRPRLVLNMCMFTGRQRGKIKPYRVNRHLFRKLADRSQLSGVQRAMW